MAAELEEQGTERKGKRKRLEYNRRNLILVHEKVEVRSVEEGFQGSWHSGTVIACERQTRRVKYDHLLRDDGSENLIEFVAVPSIFDGIGLASGTQCDYRGRIRPLPPWHDFGIFGLHYGLCVDVFYKEAWWEGVIFDHDDGSEERKIFFPDLGDEMKIGFDMLRITQDWNEVTEEWKTRGNWLFLELIEEYEQEWPLNVSVKQIWYDVRGKEDFEKVKEWTTSEKTVWKDLVLEAIYDNFNLTLNEFFRVLDFSGDLVQEALPVLQFPEPALDVTLKPKADLANSHAVVPAENICPLGCDMMMDRDCNVMHLVDHSIKVVDNPVENGGLATGSMPIDLNSSSVQPIEKELDLDGFNSVMGDDGLDMNLFTNSNVSCDDQVVCVQPHALSVLPSSTGRFYSISSNTYSEGFSSPSSNKPNGKPASSTCRRNQIWLPPGPDILPGAEFCPGSITEYALTSKGNRKPHESLTKNVRKHLSYLGWKIECKRDDRMIRLRYTSHDGKCYYSLRQVCQDLREPAAEILYPTAQDDQRSLSTSPPLLEQPQASEEAPVVSASDVVVFEPEYCPQAVVDWCMLGLEEKNKGCRLKRENKSADMRLKARKHLSALGWEFCYTMNRGNRVLHYRSPRGKCYYSLRTACEGCMAEEEVSESNASTCKPMKRINVGEEANGQLAGEKLSISSISQSMELVELGKVKVRGIRKLRKKRKNGLLYLASHLLQGQTQAHLHAGQDGFAIGLIGNKRLRHPKDLNANLPKLKERKVSRALNRLGNDLDSGYPTRVLRSRKRARQVVVPSSSHHNPRTVLSWLIDNNVVLPRAKVHYRCRKDHRPMAEGRITRDGIKCSCCHKVFTLSSFQAHAGSTYHRPAANIFLEDGRSLLECQTNMIRDSNMRSFATEPCDRMKGKHQQSINDYICSVCHYGGDLVLCDQCPSSFHKSCLGLKDLPEGDWFCPSCCCGICGQSRFDKDTEHFTDNSVLNCDQCEHQYHVGCLRKRGLVKLESYSKGSWFCSKQCEKIFWGLNKILGKPVSLGVDNLTWTLLKSVKYDSRDLDASDTEALTEIYSKLNIAVGVMHECFEPVKEPRTRRDLVEDVIFSRGSELNRLNFRGFYTVLLERNDELITVATVRVYGEKVAEVPLVGTRFQYRRLGMCRILMNELEKKLTELGVERLILPAVPSVLNAWTTSFGFSKMTDSERLNFLDYTFLDFQDTVMCQKLLTKISPGDSSLSRGTRHKLRNDINGSGDNIDFDRYSAVSEVFQAEQIEESEIVDQEPVDIAVGNGSNGGNGPASTVVVVTQPAHLECKPCHHELSPGCSVEDACHKKEGRDNGNCSLKCYKRRRISASESYEPHSTCTDQTSG